MSINIGHALVALAPETKWRVVEGTLHWEDESKQPTDKEINDKIVELQAEYDAKQYQRDRKLEYPTIEELVVALYDESDKASIIERRNAVKAKYPKPE